MTDYADGLHLIPDHCREGMQNYIQYGILPGSFMSAVLCNDLMEACLCADGINRYRLWDYAKFLHDYAPPASFGSTKRVRDWVKSKESAP